MRTIRKTLPFLFIAVLALLLSSGCTAKTAQTDIPKTPEQAGIQIADSTTCEGCHLDPEVIGTFEKPKAEATGGETKGG